MLIHQGWFTALYTQHLLVSQSFEFENLHITSTEYAANTLHQRFSKGVYPVTLLPPPRRLVPSLGLGTTWVRQPGLAVVIIPPLPPNVTCSRNKPQQTPSVEKHAHPPRVVYCAIYSTLTRFTKFRVCILQAPNMPLIRCTNVYPVTGSQFYFILFCLGYSVFL